MAPQRRDRQQRDLGNERRLIARVADADFMSRKTFAAASTLLKIMLDANSPTSCRLRAADSALSHAAKAIEIEDIEARVAQLERAAEVSKR